MTAATMLWGYRANEATIKINPYIDLQLWSIASDGSYFPETIAFEAVLWHEMIGHGWEQRFHPTENWNFSDGPGYDPVIYEEDRGRGCLRAMGY
jgi:hypothetical protein